MELIKVDPFPLGLGIWVVLGLWEMGLWGPDWWFAGGQGLGMPGRAVLSGWAPGPEKLFLAAETFVLVHMWRRTFPQRSALKY